MNKVLLVLAMVMAGLMTQVAWASELEEDRAEADALMEAGDEKRAFKAYRELARNGDQDSQYVISTLYATGTGTKKDLVDAYGWSVVAAEAGLEKLTEHSEKLYAAVPDKAKADRAAKKLVNKYGQQALQDKADRLLARGNGRRTGSCTGSRLSCGTTGSVGAVSINTVGGAGAPPVAEGGN